MARVWCGEQHHWYAFTLAMGCFTRKLVRMATQSTGNTRATEAAVEEVVSNRYGTVARQIRTVKEQYLWLDGFDSLDGARQAWESGSLTATSTAPQAPGYENARR